MSTRRTLRVMLWTTVLLCSVFVVALVLLRNWDSRGEELLTSPQEAPPIDQSEVSMRVDRRSTSNEFDQGSVTTPASIRVLDESGIPLPGAILIDAIEGRWKRVDAVPAYGTSDAEGVISIHSDQTESKFALFKSGYRITLVELQRGSRIDVTLRQGQIYTAQAVTLEGMPLQGVIYVISQWPLPDPVRSSVFPRDGEACVPGLRSNDAIYCGITDERGIVAVPGLPDGEHYAACYHPTHVRVRPNPRRVSVPAVEEIHEFSEVLGLLMEFPEHRVLGAGVSGISPAPTGIETSVQIERIERRIRASKPNAILFLTAYGEALKKKPAPMRVRAVLEDHGSIELDRDLRPLSELLSSPEQIGSPLPEPKLALGKIRIDLHDVRGRAISTRFLLMPPPTSRDAGFELRTNETATVPAMEYTIMNTRSQAVALLSKQIVNVPVDDEIVVQQRFHDCLVPCIPSFTEPFDDACAELSLCVSGPGLPEFSRVAYRTRRSEDYLWLTPGAWRFFIRCDAIESEPTQVMVEAIDDASTPLLINLKLPRR